ncbi:MAG: alanine--tRNA ligase [Halobacteriales archaeon]
MALDAEAYRLAYFEEEGFSRSTCESCGRHFWSRDPDRRTCGEPPCAPYSFIGQQSFDEAYTLEEMREAFLSFFEANDHARIDPYPVAANRWRDDVLLTQASIYDFQPLVTSGTTPPPANPLCISQPCIRMQDIDNVGKTGRHTMAFEMMAHHAFNAREDLEDPERYAYQGEVYWKDQTVRYCDAFFESVGADLERLTYIEDPWVGGGNAGPALEVIYEGAELATLVFMSMERDEDGEFELKDGNRYSPMDTYIVDTGYGLERWTWVSQGTPTVYEAVYPEVIELLTEDAGLEYADRERELVAKAAGLAGRLDLDTDEDLASARSAIADDLGVDVEELVALQEPLERVYAIADHTRTLAYMLGDGIVPSNVKAGYLARMVLRRTVRLAEEIDLSTPLEEIVDQQAARFGYEDRDVIREMVREEVEKYGETLARGRRRVRQLASEYGDRGESIPPTELIELYDSHGIHPETVAEVAAEVGASVTIPEDFYARVADRHESTALGAEAPAETPERLPGLPETEKLYYEDQDRYSFEAVVLDCFEREDGYDVVLDQTLFYPEGGGQPADTGSLSTEETSARVRDVQTVDGVIRHRVDEPLETGAIVSGRIDRERRRQLMRNHTATHVLLDAARDVLGEHVHQAGARKGVASSRLDLEHFRRIDREEVKRIERIANGTVRANHFVKQSWPDRHEAEADHGFDIYQGGIPPGRRIRLIEVGDDVQACGGTHVSRTGEIGLISVNRTERVQDGVERLVFSAGSAAVERVQEREDWLLEAAAVLDVTPEEVPRTAARFFEAWKERGKRIDELAEEVAELRATGEAAARVDLDDTEVVVRRIDAPTGELRATANAIVEGGSSAVVVGAHDGTAHVVVAAAEGTGLHAGELVGQLAALVGGGGGGPEDFAEGGGPDVDRLDALVEAVPDVVRRSVEA